MHALYKPCSLCVTLLIQPPRRTEQYHEHFFYKKYKRTGDIELGIGVEVLV